MAEQLIEPKTLAMLFEFDGVRRVDQLVQDGVITPTIVKENGRKVRRYDLIPTVQQYIRYLKEKAERRAANSNPDDTRASEADIRFKEARAEKASLEVAELKGQMYRAEDIAVVVTDMIARLRASIMALPGRLAVDCAEAKTAMETSAIIKRAVDDFLNETAAIKHDPADYRRLVMEREKWLTEQEIQDLTIPLEEQSSTSKGSEKTSRRQKA